MLSEDALGGLSVGVLPLSGQGASFVAAGAAFVVDIVVSVVVSQVTAPKPVEELAGLVYSETPKEQRTDPEASRAALVPVADEAGRHLAGAWSSSST